MEKQDKQLKKLIYKECRKDIQLSVGLYSIEEIVKGVLSIYTVGLLGTFADAVFTLNLELGKAMIFELMLCLVVMIIILPMVSLLGEKYMFAGALAHDLRLYNRFFSKTYEQATEIEAGEALYRLETDPIAFRCRWVDLMSRVVATPLAFIYLMNQGIQISGAFTAITLTVSMIRLIVPVLIKNIEAKYDKATHEYMEKVHVYENQIVEQSYIVKMYGLSQALLQKLNQLYHDYYKDTEKKQLQTKILTEQILSFLETFCVVSILLIGASMVANEIITAGAVVAMVGYFSVLNLIINNAHSIIKGIPLIKNSAERLLTIYEGSENQEGREIETFETIKATNLVFNYSDKEILKDIEFEINKGDKVVICGRNGSGKTTLLKIISGLLTQTQGNLVINQSERDQVVIGSWQQQLAYAE